LRDCRVVRVVRRGGFVSEHGVRPERVVFLVPGHDRGAGFSQRAEDVQVQAFVALAGMEAFHVAVMPRLTRRNEQQIQILPGPRPRLLLPCAARILLFFGVSVSAVDLGGLGVGRAPRSSSSRGSRLPTSISEARKALGKGWVDPGWFMTLALIRDAITGRGLRSRGFSRGCLGCSQRSRSRQRA
jgi:hypothetical protein